MKSVIDIDGSYGEGGGQVLRTALALSVLTTRPARIHSIRAGRRNPGLAPQHLTGVLALAKVCNAKVHGASIGSTEIVFEPQSGPLSGNYMFDVTDVAKGGSAGSVTLLFQTLFLPLAFGTSTSRMTLKGGTHVAWSPPFDYLKHVFLPTVARMGILAECRLDAWGFYPRGGGQIAVDIQPSRTMEPTTIAEADVQDRSKKPDAAETGLGLTPLVIVERGKLKRVWGTAVACNLPSHVAQRMANRAHNVLKESGLRAQVTPERVKGPGPGAGFFLAVEYENCLAGFSSLGKKGKSSEAVAQEACEDLLRHHKSGSPIDVHLADQLILSMALAHGQSEFHTSCISQHLLTNAHIIRQFVPARIEIAAGEGESGLVTIQGAEHL